MGVKRRQCQSSLSTLFCLVTVLFFLMNLLEVAECNNLLPQAYPPGAGTNASYNAFLTVNGSFLFIGGTNDNTGADLDAIYRFPLPTIVGVVPPQPTWSQLSTSLPTPLSGTSFAASYDGQVFYVCSAATRRAVIPHGNGQCHKGYFRASDGQLAFDKCTALTTPRYQAAVVVTRKALIVLGGYDAKGNALWNAEFLPLQCNGKDGQSVTITTTFQTTQTFSSVLPSDGDDVLVISGNVKVTQGTEVLLLTVLYGAETKQPSSFALLNYPRPGFLGTGGSVAGSSTYFTDSSYFPYKPPPPPGNNPIQFQLNAAGLSSVGIPSTITSVITQFPAPCSGAVTGWASAGQSGQQTLLVGHYEQLMGACQHQFATVNYLPPFVFTNMEESSFPIHTVVGDEYQLSLARITDTTASGIEWEEMRLVYRATSTCVGPDVSSVAHAHARTKTSRTVNFKGNFTKPAPNAYVCLNVGTCSLRLLKSREKHLKSCPGAQTAQTCFAVGCCWIEPSWFGPNVPQEGICVTREHSNDNPDEEFWFPQSSYAAMIRLPTKTETISSSLPLTPTLTHEATPSREVSSSANMTKSRSVDTPTTSVSSSRPPTHSTSSSISIATPTVSKKPTPTNSLSKSSSLAKTNSATLPPTRSRTSTHFGNTATKQPTPTLGKTKTHSASEATLSQTQGTPSRSLSQHTSTISLIPPSPSNKGTNNNYSPSDKGENLGTILVGGIILACLLVVVIVAFIVMRRQRGDEDSFNDRAGGRGRSDSIDSGRDGDCAGINQFRILDKLGAGGYGVVYRIQRKSDKREFAMKYIACQDDDERLLALKEFEVLKKLQGHPNIIPLIDMYMNWAEDMSGLSPRQQHDYEAQHKEKKKRRRQAQVKGSPPQQSGSVERLGAESAGLLQSDSEQQNSSTDGGGSTTYGSVTDRNEEEEATERRRESSARISVAPDTVNNINTASTANLYLDDEQMRSMYFNQRAGASGSGGGESTERSALMMLAGQPRYVCIIVEYFPEGDLAKYCLTYNQALIPETVVLRVCSQVAYLLSFLHAQSPPIIHRDMKPENILMDSENDRVIVTDFGLAVEMKREHLTKKVGTTYYMSPEMFSGKTSTKSDIWGLGCIIYAICTRRVTPQNTRAMFQDAKKKHFKDDVRVELRHYSRDMVDLVLWMLEVNPDSRPTAHEVIQACYDVQPKMEETTFFDETTPSRRSSMAPSSMSPTPNKQPGRGSAAKKPT